MKVGFSVRERLYASVAFEVNCDSRENVEELLEQIGENMPADDLYLRLCEIYGHENVRCHGLNDTDSIISADEWEFDEWLEPEEDET